MKDCSMKTIEKMFYNNCNREKYITSGLLKFNNKGKIIFEINQNSNLSQRHLISKKDILENKEEELLDDSDILNSETNQSDQKFEEDIISGNKSIISDNSSKQYFKNIRKKSICFLIDNFLENKINKAQFDDLSDKNTISEISEQDESEDDSNENKDNKENLNSFKETWDTEKKIKIDFNNNKNFKKKRYSNVFLINKSNKRNSCIINFKFYEINNILHNIDKSVILDSTCSICINNLKINQEISIINNCNHIFHRNCLSNWIGVFGLNKNFCPYCKASVDKGQKK